MSSLREYSTVTSVAGELCGFTSGDVVLKVCPTCSTGYAPILAAVKSFVGSYLSAVNGDGKPLAELELPFNFEAAGIDEYDKPKQACCATKKDVSTDSKPASHLPSVNFSTEYGHSSFFFCLLQLPSLLHLCLRPTPHQSTNKPVRWDERPRSIPRTLLLPTPSQQRRTVVVEQTVVSSEAPGRLRLRVQRRPSSQGSSSRNTLLVRDALDSFQLFWSFC